MVASPLSDRRANTLLRIPAHDASGVRSALGTAFFSSSRTHQIDLSVMNDVVLDF